jgi:predicted nucleic acid-binding protein
VILYCDTSALVKLYVREQGSEEFRRIWESSKRRATANIAFAEGMAAFGRRWRCGDIESDQHDGVRKRFQDDFTSMIRVPQSDEVNRRIAELVLRHPLRGFDAIHLASAVLLSEGVNKPLLFACYDEALNRAARENGFELLKSPGAH